MTPRQRNKYTTINTAVDGPPEYPKKEKARRREKLNL